MIAFDGTHFSKHGVQLAITASYKRGRWSYRLASGRLIASGLSPAQFVREFWFSDMEDTR